MPDTLLQNTPVTLNHLVISDLPPPPEESASEVEQEKLQARVQKYLAALVKEYPPFTRDIRADQRRLTAEVRDIWPKLEGWDEEAKLVQKMICDLVLQSVPAQNLNITLLLRVSLAPYKMFPDVFPTPHERALIAIFDSVNGVMRSCTVPAQEKPPMLDHMSVPAGLVVIGQLMSSVVNQFTDYRGTGMGSGIQYTERNSDRRIRGDEPADQFGKIHPDPKPKHMMHVLPPPGTMELLEMVAPLGLVGMHGASSSHASASAAPASGAAAAHGGGHGGYTVLGTVAAAEIGSHAVHAGMVGHAEGSLAENEITASSQDINGIGENTIIHTGSPFEGTAHVHGEIGSVAWIAGAEAGNLAVVRAAEALPIRSVADRAAVVKAANTEQQIELTVENAEQELATEESEEESESEEEKSFEEGEREEESAFEASAEEETSREEEVEFEEEEQPSEQSVGAESFVEPVGFEQEEMEVNELAEIKYEHQEERQAEVRFASEERREERAEIRAETRAERDEQEKVEDRDNDITGSLIGAPHVIDEVRDPLVTHPSETRENPANERHEVDTRHESPSPEEVAKKLQEAAKEEPVRNDDHLVQDAQPTPGGTEYRQYRQSGDQGTQPLPDDPAVAREILRNAALHHGAAAGTSAAVQNAAAAHATAQTAAAHAAATAAHVASTAASLQTHTGISGLAGAAGVHAATTLNRDQLQKTRTKGATSSQPPHLNPRVKKMTATQKTPKLKNSPHQKPNDPPAPPLPKDTPGT